MFTLYTGFHLFYVVIFEGFVRHNASQPVDDILAQQIWDHRRLWELRLRTSAEQAFTRGAHALLLGCSTHHLCLNFYLPFIKKYYQLFFITNTKARNMKFTADIRRAGFHTGSTRVILLVCLLATRKVDCKQILYDDWPLSGHWVPMQKSGSVDSV